MQTETIFQIIILIMSVVIHEVSHGFMAGLLGDPTAKLAGRLTLNPLKHLDLTGSILLPGLLILTGSPVMFGWAKPVPYNPYNLRAGKWGPALVAVAGPLANFLVALVFGIVLRVGGVTGALSSSFIYMASLIVMINVFLGLFNLIPVPPLDGSKVLFAILPYRWNRIQAEMERFQIILVLIIIFYAGNLLLPLASVVFSLLTGMG